MMCPAIANPQVVANDECDRARWVSASSARWLAPKRKVYQDRLRNFHWSVHRRRARCANFSGSAWDRSVRSSGECTVRTSGSRTSLPCRFSPQAGRSAQVLLWKWNLLKSVSLLLKYCHCEPFLTPPAGVRTVREASRGAPASRDLRRGDTILFTFAACILGLDKRGRNDKQSM